MLCVKCGYDNPPGSTSCLNCKVMLSNINFYKMLEPAVRNSRLKKIQEYCEGVLKEAVSVEEFALFLSSTYQHLVKLGEEIRDIVHEEDYDSFSPDEVEKGYEGMQLYEEGLSHIYLYVEDLNEEHIREGLEMVSKGNEYINKAMTLNREFRETEGVDGTL